MPTPPTGDIAWAASPMHSSPGRHQRFSRSTCTVSSLTSSQPASLVDPRGERRARSRRPRAERLDRPAAAAPPRRPWRSHSRIASRRRARSSPPCGPARCGRTAASGSAGSRRSLNHSTSIGAPRSLDLRGPPPRASPRCGRRRRRPVARAISISPSGAARAHAGDAAVRLEQARRAAVDISRRNVGSFFASPAMKSRKSHCGMKAMNGICVGRCAKSAITMCAVADPARRSDAPCVRQPQEALEQAELVHQLERGRVDRVAAEVAQEIRVLLEHDGLDAGAGEEKADHQPAGPPPTMQQCGLDHLWHGRSPR